MQYTNICISFCKYHPQPIHIVSPLSTKLSTNNKDFHILLQKFTAGTFCAHIGPDPKCINTE